MGNMSYLHDDDILLDKDIYLLKLLTDTFNIQNTKTTVKYYILDRECTLSEAQMYIANICDGELHSRFITKGGDINGLD